ncbi:outer mitochondrial membrane transport complex protein [Ditylenchus destructor]|nr:outer mitochondrial membrane transport complex protein [Ditylenchus destructor]
MSASNCAMAELRIWPSEFGLPSVDTACLQFMVATKLCAAPVSFVYDSHPWSSPSGMFPLFMEGSRTITSFEEYVEYLRSYKQDVVLDNELVPSQICEFDAYDSYLKQKLLPALTYLLWLDDANFGTVTHYWYSSKLPFGYNSYYIMQRKRQAKAFIEACRKSPTQLTLDGIQVLNALSAKLGDNKYFCGDKPCSLDALIFGYLAPLLRLPLPTDRLQLHLTSCPNLVRFVESLISIYLPLTDTAIQEQTATKKFWAKRKAEAQKVIESKRISKEQKRAERERAKDMPIRDTILFAMGALVCCVLFALHTGIIKISPAVQSKAIMKISLMITLPADILINVFNFANRWELDRLPLVNHNFSNIVNTTFKKFPQRSLKKLVVIIDNDEDLLPGTSLLPRRAIEAELQKPVEKAASVKAPISNFIAAIDDDGLEFYVDFRRVKNNFLLPRSRKFNYKRHDIPYAYIYYIRNLLSHNYEEEGDQCFRLEVKIFEKQHKAVNYVNLVFEPNLFDEIKVIPAESTISLFRSKNSNILLPMSM